MLNTVNKIMTKISKSYPKKKKSWQDYTLTFYDSVGQCFFNPNNLKKF